MGVRWGRRMAALGLALALLLPVMGHARDEGAAAGGNATKDVFLLGQIEVVDQADEVANPTVTRIGSESFQKFDRYDLARAANLVPGVTISEAGARNELMVNVRGFDIKHVPIYVDGIPVYVPYDGYPDLGRFTTFDLSEIVVSKGFSSVLYGPNTMGGSINMVTRRPTEEFEASGGAGGAPGDYHSYLNVGTNQGLWYAQVSGSYMSSDGFHLSDDFEPVDAEGGGKRDNSYRSDGKVSIKLGLTPNETDEYVIGYVNQHGEKGVPVYAGESDSVKKRYWQWPYWDKESVYFLSRTAIFDDNYVKTRLYYDTFKNKLMSYDDDTYSTQNKKSAFTSFYDDYTYGGSFEFGTRFIPRNLIKIAAHYKHDYHKEHNEGDPEQEFEEDIFSIGLEDTIDITDDIYVIAGVSYDYVETATAEDNQDGEIVDFPKGDASSFNPQIGLFYEIGDGLAHASVAYKTRMPSIKDKFSYKMGTALPNPDLDPEVSINYEVGYKHTFLDRLTVEGNVFYNDISDYILMVTVPDPDDPNATLEQNQNVGEVDQYGVELGFSGTIIDSLSAGVNYTYLHYDNKDSEDELTNTPEQKVFAYLEYTPLERLSLLASLQYETSRYSSSDGERETDDFTLLGLKASYEFVEGFTIEAGVSNLLDEDYEYDEGYPEPGRTFFANFRFEL